MRSSEVYLTSNRAAMVQKTGVDAAHGSGRECGGYPYLSAPFIHQYSPTLLWTVLL